MGRQITVMAGPVSVRHRGRQDKDGHLVGEEGKEKKSNNLYLVVSFSPRVIL